MGWVSKFHSLSEKCEIYLMISMIRMSISRFLIFPTFRIPFFRLAYTRLLLFLYYVCTHELPRHYLIHSRTLKVSRSCSKLAEDISFLRKRRAPVPINARGPLRPGPGAAGPRALPGAGDPWVIRLVPEYWWDLGVQHSCHTHCVRTINWCCASKDLEQHEHTA